MSIQLDMSCPAGGSFYACADGSNFVGCCGSNPCANGCPAGLLEPAGFDPNQYGQFGDQQCDAGLFYTCIFDSQSSSTFMGCCKSNACSQKQCPTDDLAGAFLSDNPTKAAPFLALNGTVEIVASSSSASTTSTASPTVAGVGASSTTSSSSSATILPSSQPQTNVGAIAGGAVGGFAVLMAFILGLLYLRHRQRKANTAAEPQPAMTEKSAAYQPPDSYFPSKAPPQWETHSPHPPFSPQPPYSPGPPSYIAESEVRTPHYAQHMSYEMPAEQPTRVMSAELDSGQMYHPYRSSPAETPV